MDDLHHLGLRKSFSFPNSCSQCAIQIPDGMKPGEIFSVGCALAFEKRPASIIFHKPDGTTTKYSCDEPVF